MLFNIVIDIAIETFSTQSVASSYKKVVQLKHFLVASF